MVDLKDFPGVPADSASEMRTRSWAERLGRPVTVLAKCCECERIQPHYLADKSSDLSSHERATLSHRCEACGGPLACGYKCDKGLKVKELPISKYPIEGESVRRLCLSCGTSLKKTFFMANGYRPWCKNCRKVNERKYVMTMKIEAKEMVVVAELMEAIKAAALGCNNLKIKGSLQVKLPGIECDIIVANDGKEVSLQK